MIRYKAEYRDANGNPVKVVHFEADNLHEAIRIVSTTQEVPIDAQDLEIAREGLRP